MCFCDLSTCLTHAAPHSRRRTAGRTANRSQSACPGSGATSERAARTSTASSTLTRCKHALCRALHTCEAAKCGSCSLWCNGNPGTALAWSLQSPYVQPGQLDTRVHASLVQSRRQAADLGGGSTCDHAYGYCRCIAWLAVVLPQLPQVLPCPVYFQAAAHRWRARPTARCHAMGVECCSCAVARCRWRLTLHVWMCLPGVRDTHTGGGAQVGTAAGPPRLQAGDAHGRLHETCELCAWQLC